MRFPNSALALQVFDKLEPAANALVDKAYYAVNNSLKDINKALRLHRNLEIKVNHAFWQDTKHINHIAACLVTPISYIRKLVEDDRKENS